MKCEKTEARNSRRWGVILAGGDGARLRPLTRFLCGDDRPKQFCSLIGPRTLLQETRERTERSIPPGQIVYSVSRAHEAHYRRELAGNPSRTIVQPCNKGTAPAILTALLRIAQMDRDAIVAILPSDHHYSPEKAFTASLDAAFAAVEARPERVVLLGAPARAAEVDLGWIEVASAPALSHPGVFRVRRFQEKPPLAVAERLYRNRSLWNTFVMVGYVQAFFELAFRSTPEVIAQLAAHYPPGERDETQISQSLYDRIEPTDFSRQILSPGAERLVAMALGEVRWEDLGTPERVVSAIQRRDSEAPAWIARWQASLAA